MSTLPSQVVAMVSQVISRVLLGSSYSLVCGSYSVARQLLWNTR